MLKVLIVEDDRLIALALERMITGLGHSITGVVEAGEDVAESLADRRPDLVLLDIRLKGEMDGVEVAEGINATEAGLPFFFLTGNSDPTTVMRAMSTDPFGFLFKPVQKRDLSELLGRVEGALMMRGA